VKQVIDFHWIKPYGPAVHNKRWQWRLCNAYLRRCGCCDHKGRCRWAGRQPSAPTVHLQTSRSLQWICEARRRGGRLSARWPKWPICKSDRTKWKTVFRQEWDKGYRI